MVVLVAPSPGDWVRVVWGDLGGNFGWPLRVTHARWLLVVTIGCTIKTRGMEAGPRKRLEGGLGEKREA